MTSLDIILVIGLVLAALVTVMAARVLRSAIGLAVASLVVSIMMFRLNAPLAAVFELSVCAGLIPVIFISVIGLTRRLDTEALTVRRHAKWRRFWPLPVLVLVVCGVLLVVRPVMDVPPPVAAAAAGGVREVLWNLRHIDLIGQIVILLVSAFGVVILVKETNRG
ncbi:MAG: NADH-quinone oxidoreductase subunit J [Phycisphaerae bacterium]